MKLNKILFFFLAMIGIFPVASYAALPAAATSALATLQADALELIDAVWPVTVAVTVAFILLRLFKRGASSAV